MLRFFGNSRKKLCIILACILVFSLSLACFIFSGINTIAATTNVDTFAELEDACQKSGTVNITSKIAVTDTITVPKGVTVYLTCSHDAGSVTTDIYRAQGFHGHLFKVNDGATVYVRCAIDGNNKDGSGNLRGTGATGTESSGYYGQALILNYGNVIMDNDKSVLKNNYNAYNNDYKAGLLWTYDGAKYYGLSASPEKTSLAGSAILCVNGKFTMSNGQIYGCYADNGPAIYVCNGYSGDTVKVSGGTIKNNVARRYGGAIFAASRKPYDDYSDSSSFIGSRTLNSTGSNAMLTISGGKICNNLARLNSGAVWTGFGGTLYMSGGSIYNNVAVEEGGGGIRVNAGGSGTTGGWMCFANPGGQAWIAGGSIYNNTCATNGGGITVADNDDTNNQLKISGGSIYSNTAGSNGGGVYCASKLIYSSGNTYKNSASGNGGGVYLTGTGVLTMSGGSIHTNTATNYGGGVYLTTAGSASTISGGNIYSNKANYGGGIATLRTAGLTLSNVKVYSNTASGSGGGVRSTGKLTINSGFYYGNTNIGVYVAGGSSTINGGKFGVSAYTDYSTYTVSRNTVSQLTIAENATVTINSTSYPRIVSTLLDGEAIGANKGIVNNGTLTVSNTSSNAFDIYGTGTSVYNAGTFNINGNFNILSSGKDGTDTVQQRLGIQNTAAGTVTMNSSDAEIKYCGYRGVVNNGNFVLKAGKIYNCTSANITSDNGGGVVVSGDDSAFTMSGGEIYNNSANYGGGVYFTTSGKASTFSGGSIYNNTASKSGGGIGNSRTNGVTLSGTAVYSNKANYGGGVYNAGVLNLKGSNIYSNSAIDSHGGGLYITGDNSVLTMTSGVIRNNNAASHGGGIYFTTAGKASTISGGSIYENEATGSGGAFLSYRTNGVTVSGGSIYSNSAGTYGGAIYIGDSLFTMTGGTVYSNNASTNKGNGVFIAGDSTFNMSKTALVKTDNDVFLNSDNYITVPTVFTGTKNIRALVTGDNFVVGRVIAKYGDTSDDAGSEALYWNATAPNMSEQYFTLNDSEKVLRSGDQGAADETDSIANQDVFISETYTVSFDGNLTGYTVTVPEGFLKYWYESVSNFVFADAKVNSSLHSFQGWNSESDGTGTGYTSPLSYSANEDLILYAQWKTSTFTINYYSNYADSASDLVANEVSADKNVLVMQSILEPTSDLSNGMYNYLNGSLNLGRTYYTGTGYWNTMADGSGYSVHQDTAFDDLQGLAEALGADVTNGSLTINVYAQWKANTLTINYYSNYADSSSDEVLNAVSGDKNVLVKKSVLVPTSDLSYGLSNYSADNSTLSLGKEGYTGTGYWNTKTDGTGYGVHEDTAFDHYQDLALDLGVDVSKGNATVNVYAQWKPIENLVDLDYNGNGATEGEDWTETFNLSGSDSYTLSDNSSAFARLEKDKDTGVERLFKFTGWTIGSKFYPFGEKVSTSVLSEVASAQDGRERKVVTIYATWDEFPTIKAVDRWFTLDEAQGGKITLEELLKTASAVDGEIGDVTDFAAGEGTFTIIDFDAEEFKKFTTTSSVTVTYQAIDKAGNETYRTVTVHIVDKIQQIVDAVTRFVRFISDEFFKDSKGNYVSEADGGFNSKSRWINDTEYVELLTKVFSNKQDEETGAWDTVYETWTFTKEDIEDVKGYIGAYGLGNSKNDNALSNFYDMYKS